MFTVSAFKLMRRNCKEDLDKLLDLLRINKPNWDRDDEFKISKDLDNKIDKKLCALLKSDSDIDGYAKLLEIGNVKFSFSETRKELLEKILANRDKILQGVAAQARNNNSTSDSDLSLLARIVRFFKSLFGSEESSPAQPSNKLSREEIKNLFPILEQVNKIFNAI